MKCRSLLGLLACLRGSHPSCFFWNKVSLKVFVCLSQFSCILKLNWLDREYSNKCFLFKASGHCIDIIQTIEELNVPIKVLFMSLYQERLKQFVFYNLPNCHILLKKFFLFSIWMNLCFLSLSLSLCVNGKLFLFEFVSFNECSLPLLWSIFGFQWFWKSDRANLN